MHDFAPQHDFLIGIDSDGCVFDTMELKHKECFIPNTIHHWGLQGVAKYAREAAEFVNLYSKSRGINRYPALVEVLGWVNRRPEVKRRGVQVDVPASLLDWIGREKKPCLATLEKEVDRTGDPGLKKTLAWSKAVDDAVEQMVRDVPPFPGVRESLEKLTDRADVFVVSATPDAALRREWEEHDLARYVRAIFGQEFGTKADLLQAAAKYPPHHVLMIGDAPGDARAATANKALFYPINPGEEEASWRRFSEEGVERFFSGTFDGDYQAAILAEFDRYLPDRPPWPVDE
jgi:phosphoglycolate phosphatase-like HAD superfamily hydrolase